MGACSFLRLAQKCRLYFIHVSLPRIFTQIKVIKRKVNKMSLGDMCDKAMFMNKEYLFCYLHRWCPLFDGPS